MGLCLLKDLDSYSCPQNTKFDSLGLAPGSLHFDKHPYGFYKQVNKMMVLKLGNTCESERRGGDKIPHIQAACTVTRGISGDVAQAPVVKAPW